jgi:hypothetical protein
MFGENLVFPLIIGSLIISSTSTPSTNNNNPNTVNNKHYPYLRL